MSATLFGISHKILRRGIFAVLSGLALLAIVWMAYNYFVTDPFDPNLDGTARYGHNGDGVFQTFALLTLVELAILAAALLIRAFGRFYWLRLLILLIAFGGWMFLMAVSGMHGGGVDGIHTLYLLGVNFALFLLLIFVVAAQITGARRTTGESND